MTSLWHGHWRTKARVVSGLILFTYVLFHLLNVGLGLFSLDLMERAQDWRQTVTRSTLGTAVLYSALVTHLFLGLWRLARKRTLKMPISEFLQIALGVIIPLLLFVHVVHTRGAYGRFEVNDRMGYITGLLWDTTSGLQQAILLVVVWIHGCIGLHFWLRSRTWWKASIPYLIGIATLIPAFALAGFMVQGRAQKARFRDPETFAELAAFYNWPSREAFAEMLKITNGGLTFYWGLLGLVLLVLAYNRWGHRGASVPIQFIDGPKIRGQRGMTLLEMSRNEGIAHFSLCGGKGRCTTCRVIIEDGIDRLPPASPAELRALAAVNAPPNARLACQIKPTDPATVLRVFRPDGRHARAHESQGQERRLAILFLDMRGFTARTTGQLPYDVVFLLNRFFDAIVPSITGAGGTVDKYLGDGLLAVFDNDSEASSARAALDAARGISSALETFNRTLASESSDPVAIGMGLHLGELVMGEIGSADNAPKTIIGDTVNATSRLEAETKALGVELLVSEALLKAAEVNTGHLDLVALHLRGVSKPIQALPVQRASKLEQVASTQLSSTSRET